MKVTVRNLGVLKEAEIDLKPLTIFVGPNNSGKTWLAYTISSILTRHGLEEYTRAYVTGKIPPAYPLLDTAIQHVLDEGNAKIDLVQFANEYGEIYFNNVASIAPQWLSEFWGTDRTSFENLETHIQLTETKRAFK